MKVVLDTSSLMSVFEQRFDVFDKCEAALKEPCIFYATQSTVAELKSIAAAGGKKRLAAGACIALIDKKYTVIKTKGKADDVLVELNPKEYVVVTNDKRLMTRLREKGFRILTQAVGKMRMA